MLRQGPAEPRGCEIKAMDFQAGFQGSLCRIGLARPAFPSSLMVLFPVATAENLKGNFDVYERSEAVIST